MKPPTYEQDGFEAVDQWAYDNEPTWNTASRSMYYRGQPEIKRLQLLASTMLQGMMLYRDLATRLQKAPPELETARAAVKSLREKLRIEREEHAKTLALLERVRKVKDENPTSTFEKLFGQTFR